MAEFVSFHFLSSFTLFSLFHHSHSISFLKLSAFQISVNVSKVRVALQTEVETENLPFSSLFLNPVIPIFFLSQFPSTAARLVVQCRQGFPMAETAFFHSFPSFQNNL